MKTKLLFCANDQKETNHGLSLSPSGEIVMTCECGRSVKMPAGLDKEGIDAYVKNHKEQNEGQVSVEAQEKMLDEISDTKVEQPAVEQPVTGEVVEGTIL